MLLLAAGAAGGGYLVHSLYSAGRTADSVMRRVPGMQAIGEAVSRALGIGEAGLDLVLSKEEQFPSDVPLPPRASSKRFHIPRRAEKPAAAHVESPAGAGELAVHYERALAEKGWRMDKPGIKTEGGTLYAASKEGRLLSVWIGARQEGGSFVVLTVGREAGRPD
ncbi:MAG: hypothetical protein A2V83_08080 [Nitrospirae bacterium RBG_16_64_22]|nr:MAG: hypothetical protein A2V83_08080 [Nitrospirae bacterium RBG_16_64_22]